MYRYRQCYPYNTYSLHHAVQTNTHPISPYPGGHRSECMPSCCRSADSLDRNIHFMKEYVSVIVQFDVMPLLIKYPMLRGNDLTTHSYLGILDSLYAKWFAQMKEYIPNMHVHHIYQLLISGFSATVPRGAIKILDDFVFVKAIYPDKRIKFSDRSSERSYKYDKSPERDDDGFGFRNWAKIREREPLFLDGTRLPETEINQNNLRTIRIPLTHQLQDENGERLSGSGIRVAVVDMGFLPDNLPEENMIRIVDLDPDQDERFREDEWHGTQMTQVILNVAPRARILGYVARTYSGILRAMEVIAGDEINVISMSLSIDDPDIGGMVEGVVNSLIDRGVVAINSSGNDGRVGGVDFPGASDKMISVGATTRAGDQIADYSDCAPRILKPDLFAPGTVGVIEEGMIITARGTSYSAAYVSGSVALLKQLHRGWNPAQIKYAITGTATAIVQDTPAAEYAGIINVYGAAFAGELPRE